MAMNTNTSSKYDNITCKVLIHSGSPTFYQLKPKEEKIGSLTRMTLGKKDPNKNNKTILLVGETGAGKSTLINALVNYAMGVEWEDDVWFQIVEGETRSQSESQTSDVIVYQIFGFEDKPMPFSLTIIDTPGYGDTRGIEQDYIVSQRLLDLFRSVDGVHEINAVGLVMKASDNHLTDRLRYIFDSVVSLFGKDIEKNIVTLITHSDGRTPKNGLKTLEDAKIKCARNEQNQPVHFLFNNCHHEDRTENTEVLRCADEISMKGMKQFTNFLRTTEPQKLETTVNVLYERIILTACIQNLEERTELIDLKKTQIQQTQDGLKKHEVEMKKSKKFTVETDVVYTRLCTICTGKCPVSDHVKDNWKYVEKKMKVKQTLENVKQKYETNKEESEKLWILLETLQKEMETLEAKKTPLVYEAYQHVVKLEQIALNEVSLATYVHLDLLIEEMEKRNDTEKVYYLKQRKSRKYKGFLGGLRYINKLPQMVERRWQ